MFIVQCIKADGSVRYTDAEWDYRNDKLNWNRAFSFLPFNNMPLLIRADEYGNVTIQYRWN